MPAVLLQVLATALTLLLGVYVTALLDRFIGAFVAGRSLELPRLVAAPARSAAQLLLQSSARTERPDRALWALAPALLGGLAACALAAVPLTVVASQHDVASGIVLFGAVMALVMVAVYLNGWAPNAVLPLIGGYRFVASALSYEMPLALVLIAAALPAESLSIADIARSQQATWNVLRQPLGLPLYLIAGLGLAFWGPLNFADAHDLAGGTAAELSGVQLLLWRVARLSVLFAIAAMGAAAFLAGPYGPWLPGPVWMSLKILALLGLLLAIGHGVARVRLERFVVIAWTVLIPLALIDVFASGLLAIWQQSS